VWITLPEANVFNPSTIIVAAHMSPITTTGRSQRRLEAIFRRPSGASSRIFRSSLVTSLNARESTRSTAASNHSQPLKAGHESWITWKGQPVE
jgi:hypothetical protein